MYIYSIYIISTSRSARPTDVLSVLPSVLDLALPTLLFALSFDLFALPFGFSEIYLLSTKKVRQNIHSFYKIYLSSTISDCLFWVVGICIDFLKICQSKLPSLSHGLPSFLGSKTALSTIFKRSARTF